MSLLGSALGRGLAGAGGAAADIASRYIDQELLQQRAQALADIQHANAVRLDQYQNSPDRQATLRGNARDATLSQAEAARAAELEGLQDQPLLAARTARGDAEAADTTRRGITSRKQELTDLTPAEIAAANARTEGTMGTEAKRAGLLAEAQQRVAAKYREPKPVDPFEKMPPAVKLSLQSLQTEARQISDAMVKAQADGNWFPDKNPSQGALMVRHRAINVKMQTMLAPYMGEGGAPAANADDPLGILGDAPIDPNKPKINNADGSTSTERTITIEADGKFVNLPTIVSGKQVSEDEAVRLWRSGKNRATGEFRSLEEAVSAARKRSDDIGKTLTKPGRDLDVKRDFGKQDAATFQAQAGAKAAAAFAATDLSDPAAAQELQDSELFDYLSRQQKEAVFNAVRGR